MVSQGTKKTTCSFTIFLKDEKIEDNDNDIEIICSSKPKKKITVTDLVYTTKTLMRITLSFTVQKTKVKVTSSAVEKGKSYSSELLLMFSPSSLPAGLH